MDPKVISINISKGGIPKLPVDEIFINTNGLEGDGHNHEKHNSPLQAVCLQDVELLEQLNKEGYKIASGTTGENITLENTDINSLAIGTILEFSSGVIIELTKVRKPCYVLDSINPSLKENIIGRCGMYAKVIKEGIVKKNDNIKVIKSAFSTSY